jgi:hypothetical protein
MNEISKKKQNSDSSTEKTYYNINSFRGLKMDKTKPTNEIKIKNNSNLTTRFFEMNKYNNNNKDNSNDKLRTANRNKIISNKMHENNITVDKNKTNK